MWFKKQITLSEEEQEILETIEIMCNNDNSEVRVDPSSMDYYISNKNKHYSVILTDSYIHLTNTVTNDSSSHRGEFMDLCKDLAKKRATQDRLKVKDGMLQRRKDMLVSMKNNLKAA